jgi:hypothetical protein
MAHGPIAVAAISDPGRTRTMRTHRRRRAAARLSMPCGRRAASVHRGLSLSRARGKGGEGRDAQMQLLASTDAWAADLLVLLDDAKDCGRSRERATPRRDVNVFLTRQATSTE